MPLPIKTLPIVERWECTGCGKCCRGNVVPLDDDDLKRFREQRWDKHPDFRGKKTLVKRSLFAGSYRLAQRDDGTCVFLNDDGLCQIHKEFGFENKPLVCQMYPLQIVPAGNTAYLTLRRSCPTAAADQGRTMNEHQKEARRFVNNRPQLAEQVPPPKITRHHRRSWKETLIVTGAIERLMTKQEFPLIRRLVHGLRFCDLLEQCRLRRLDAKQLNELVTVLAESAVEQSSDLFRDRQEPSRAARTIFRLIVLNYLRLHPLYKTRESWRERWRMAGYLLKFAGGRDTIPQIHPDFPEASFEQLEEPLGHLTEEIQRPFTSYFEAHAVSKQYAIVSRPSWSIVEKFRALAVAYPVALWMTRYFKDKSVSDHEIAIDMVTTIDRGQGHNPLTNSLHRQRISSLANQEQLERLAIWYAR